MWIIQVCINQSFYETVTAVHRNEQYNWECCKIHFSLQQHILVQLKTHDGHHGICHTTKMMMMMMMMMTLLYHRQHTLDITPSLDATFSLGSRLTKHRIFSGPLGHWNTQHSLRTKFLCICSISITSLTHSVHWKIPLASLGTVPTSEYGKFNFFIIHTFSWDYFQKV